MSKPLMAKATAVWLVDNTTLTFTQIAEFCGLHELEVNGIADGEVAQGIKGFDPIVNRQLTPEEIRRCERDPKAKLRLMRERGAEGETKRAEGDVVTWFESMPDIIKIQLRPFRNARAVAWPPSSGSTPL